jgi:hypothetical protein
MARRVRTQRLWSPGRVGSQATISVIERGDPEDDRTGLPFGFSRVLVEEERAAMALGQRFLEEYNRMNTPSSDGWDEHAEALSS